MPDVPLAVIRPDEWNLPLFLHVLGAMLLVGTLLLAGLVLFARRDAGLGFRVLLVGVLPSYLLMRIAGEWIASEENFGENEPDWLTIGYVTADLGALLILVSLVLTGIAARRARTTEGGGALTRVSGGIAYLLLAAYVVSVWAMTAKPG
ncbi:MAG: hypothetical protein M3188_06460 [Actinomycetota bacterium]|nr:hypothetical protein [Actinomycetota bacterium]